MSKSTHQKLNLEQEPLWKRANEIAEHVYKVLPELPEEEKWDTTSKLHSAAVDLLFYVAQGLGKGSPAGREYEWGDARKHASALFTLYRFAGKQDFLKLDPEVVVKLQNIIKDIDVRQQAAYEQTDKAAEDELARWRKKYKIWKEMADKEPKI